MSTVMSPSANRPVRDRSRSSTTVSSAPSSAPTGSLRLLITGLVVWAGAVAALSAAGAFGFLEPFGVPIVIVASIAVPALWYVRSSKFQATLETVGARRLTAVHLMRYAGAAWILWMGANGVMNHTLSLFSGYGDMVAATAALAVLVFPATRRRFIAAHVVSLGDFATSLTVGLGMTVANPDALAGGSDFPVAIVLFFIVGFYSVNSIAVLHALLRRQDRWPIARS